MRSLTTRKWSNSQLTQEMVLLRNFLELVVIKESQLDEGSGWKLLRPKGAYGGGLYQKADCSVLGPRSQLHNLRIQQIWLAALLHQPFLSITQRFVPASCCQDRSIRYCRFPGTLHRVQGIPFPRRSFNILSSVGWTSSPTVSFF